MMNKQQGPDPEVEQAAARLKRTKLSPLEEVMFESWANANQLEDHDSPDDTYDYRGLYKEANGKVFPPGQLKNMTQEQADIQTMMKAHKDHEDSNPMNLLHHDGSR